MIHELKPAATVESGTRTDQHPEAPLRQLLLGGSLLMLIGSGTVSILNLAYNVAVARMLGPEAFGHAAAVVTLLMVLSALNLAYQLVSAKFIARNAGAAAKAQVYRALRRKSWYVGLGLGALLWIFSGAVSSYLNLPDSQIVVLLAAGIAFYVPLGVKRGALQGMCQFEKLAGNFVLETVVKLAAAVTLIQLGFGVEGAVGAITLSVVVAYFFPRVHRDLEAAPAGGIPASFREGIQAIVFFVGQVIINNIDILLVKHFFDANGAGQYAAVALVGRVVYVLSWSVTSAMVPISAGGERREDNRGVLLVPVSFVSAIGVFATIFLGLFSEVVIRFVFGAGFANHAQIGTLLVLNAAASGIYSLAVVLMAYEISRKLANVAWVQLAFSAASVLGVYMFHSTLKEVLAVQVVLRVALLVAVALPFLRTRQAEARDARVAANALLPDLPLKVGRRVAEPEIIAAFLRNEFYHGEYDKDREQFRELVLNPDTSNEVENALRRSLLFRRRDTMWYELPPDTQWFEVELDPMHLKRVSMFPRAQWRTVSNGDFMLENIVEQVKTHRYSGKTRAFIHKLMALSCHLRTNADNSMILLIATDDRSRMTVIEGNHRVTSAMINGPEVALNRFRWVCGFSARMHECCWYETNLGNVLRYIVKRLRLQIFHDHDADIRRLLAEHPLARASMVNESAGKTA